MEGAKPAPGSYIEDIPFAAHETNRWQKSEMPDDIRVDSLSNEQMADLNRLKEWLYHRRTTARQEAERTERRQQKETEAAKRKTEQPALFEF